jgi:hypothetical protein
MQSQSLAAGLAGVVVSASLALAAPLPINFTINQPRSGLNATLAAGGGTAGSLLGDWTADTNPTGTRTKPGLFGSFGNTENLPVDVEVGLAFDGNINSRTSGSFGVVLDADLGGLVLSDFDANFLANGNAEVPLNLSLLFDAFRTRNPSSTYPGGIPFEVPIGNATISTLRATQIGTAAPGTLTPIGTNRFEFTVAPIVALTATIDFLGNPIDIPGAPLPLLLGGEITITGDSALLTSVRPIDLGNTLNPDQPLPEIPFALPTILPPGGTANVLLNLTLNEVFANLNGTLTLEANGTVVPAPGAATFALLFSATLAARRRR